MVTVMSQKIIFMILKNNLGGSGTSAQIKSELSREYPDISLNTVNHKLTRLRKWGSLGYNTHKKLWKVTGDY